MRKVLLAVALITLIALPATARAQYHQRPAGPPACPNCPAPVVVTGVPASPTVAGFPAPRPPAAVDGTGLRVVATAEEVLAEVNAGRVARGLRPFVYDDGLARGAYAAAVARARSRTEGHTPNDFAFLPPGTRASAAGCAAWPVGMGWGSCCHYDDYRYAGAGYCVGADGKRYMHLFVR